MNSSSINSRIEALKRSIDKKIDLPKAICKLTDGTITQFVGFNVLQPFLDGKITEIVCEDANTAYMLRAMDIEKTIKIELISIESGDRIKRVEV